MHIQLPKFKLAYDDRGSGQALLFVHGFPLSRRLWEPQLEGLSGAARVITPDLRGHNQSGLPGGSAAAPGPFSMDMLADDLADLLEALSITQPVVLCGLSMGGYVAFAFYRRYPERVASLVLAATRAGADSPEARLGREKSAALAASGGTEPTVTGMLPKMFAPQTYTSCPDLVELAGVIMRSVTPQAVVGDLLAMQTRSDSTSLLAHIHCPALVLHGSDDQIIPLSEAQAMAEAIPGGRLHVLEGAGHLLNLEQPQAFNQAVLEFITPEA